MDWGETDTIWFMMVFEGTFLVDIIVNFLLTYEVEGSGHHMERDLAKIASNYFWGTFKNDLFPLLPLQFIDLNKGRGALFLLIKLLRLWKGFKIFNIPILMRKIKQIYKERIMRKIEDDKELAED